MELIEIPDALKEKLANAESLEEVVALCAAEGIEVTKEQLQDAWQAQNEELDVDALDHVSGGAIGIRLPNPAVQIAKWLRSKLFGK